MKNSITSGDKKISFEEMLEGVYLMAEMACDLGYGPRTTLGCEISDQMEVLENIIEANNKGKEPVYVEYKPRFNNKVRNDIISLIEGMLSDDTIEMLNKSNYSKSELSNKLIVNKQKRKNTTTVDIAMSSIENDVNINLRLTELYTNNDFKLNYRKMLSRNTKYFNKAVVNVLVNKLMDKINPLGVTLEVDISTLLDKCIINIQPLQYHVLKYTHTGRITKLNREAIIKELSYLCRYRRYKGGTYSKSYPDYVNYLYINTYREDRVYIDAIVDDLLTTCFDLDLSGFKLDYLGNLDFTTFPLCK